MKSIMSTVYARKNVYMKTITAATARTLRYYRDAVHRVKMECWTEIRQHPRRSTTTAVDSENFISCAEDTKGIAETSEPGCFSRAKASLLEEYISIYSNIKDSSPLHHHHDTESQ